MSTKMKETVKGTIKHLTRGPVSVIKGLTILDLLGMYKSQMSDKPVAAIYNNQIVDLQIPIMSDFEIEFLPKNTRWGASVYRRSLTHVLIQAVYEIYPKAILHIGQSLANGYYFDVIFKKGKLTQATCKKIESAMRKIIKERRPFEITLYDIQELHEIFTKQGFHDKSSLLRAINQREILAVKCGNFIDIYHGPYVPDTGYITEFSLIYYPPGLVVRYPKIGGPSIPSRQLKEPNLFSAYKEAARWNKILGVENVADLNETVLKGKIDDIIMMAEGLHENKIVKVADEILSKKGQTRLILIAGPSSSGKTTFSRRLRVQLEVSGLKTAVLSTDDYFVDRKDTPRNKRGEYDFESIKAVDIRLLNEHLSDILRGKTIRVPRFNFHTGKRLKSRFLPLRLEKDQILIVEGIHSLNPQLTKKIPERYKYKIYVSALSQLCIDSHNRIFTSDTRLLRRIVRDRLFRGYSALETVKRWPDVREGEEINIFPFQENADTMFNSALVYEHSVLKMYAERFLKEISPQDHYYVEAARLLDFLDLFVPVTPHNVPTNSILREFIGGSSFVY
ncbi:MAG: nucleoside kinase [Candidatus Aureabacteria bacterium]|nr:nucleoside kinase [Candidatus Auribacterota bacterium]